MTTIMQARALVAAIDAALEHGLLRELAEGPRDPLELAEALGLSPEGCARVLAVLAAEGLLVRDGRGLRASEAVRHELLAHELVAAERQLWESVPELLGTGRTRRMASSRTERAATYHGSTPLLARMFAPAAEILAGRLAPGLAEHSRPSVLDVGAGSGVWSLAFLERLPLAHATAIDLAGVLPRFVERAEALGVRDRIATVPGDYHDLEPRGRHDVVILANVLHLERADDASRLLARWGRAVALDGTLVVVDLLSPTAEAPAHAAYALHLALRVPGGRPHLEPEIRGWLAGAGFGRVEPIRLEAENGALGARPGPEGAGLGALCARR